MTKIFHVATDHYLKWQWQVQEGRGLRYRWVPARIWCSPLRGTRCWKNIWWIFCWIFEENLKSIWGFPLQDKNIWWKNICQIFGERIFSVFPSKAVAADRIRIVVRVWSALYSCNILWFWECCLTAIWALPKWKEKKR